MPSPSSTCTLLTHLWIFSCIVTASSQEKHIGKLSEADVEMIEQAIFVERQSMTELQSSLSELRPLAAEAQHILIDLNSLRRRLAPCFDEMWEELEMARYGFEEQSAYVRDLERYAVQLEQTIIGNLSINRHAQAATIYDKELSPLRSEITSEHCVRQDLLAMSLIRCLGVYRTAVDAGQEVCRSRSAHIQVMLENLRRHRRWLEKRRMEGATDVQNKMLECGKKKEELELQNRALKVQTAYRARIGKRRFARIWKEHTEASTIIQRSYRNYKNRALGKEQGIKQMEKMLEGLYRKMKMPAKRALISVQKVYENIVEDPRGAPSLESRILDNAISRCVRLGIRAHIHP